MVKVLITGIAGFLGTHVAEHFKSRGWEVCGIDNLTDYELKRAKFNVVKSREHNKAFLKLLNVEFKRLDCRTVSHHNISKLFGKIDFIVHCSAQPAMTIALENPVYDADDNIRSCVNMLTIAKFLNVPFVNCSSVHVYGNAGNSDLIERETRFEAKVPEINENTKILNGELTPLHVSKYATELYTNSFSEMFKMKTANFRFTGMYGERQFGGMDHGWVANFAIRNILDREITIFGTEKQVRDILYAKDAARAFECWFNAGCPKGTYNIGGGIKNSISLIECIREISLITGKRKRHKLEGKRQGDLWYFVCDYKKAERDFGWSPMWSNKEGLQKLCGWIEDNKEILK